MRIAILALLISVRGGCVGICDKIHEDFIKPEEYATFSDLKKYNWSALERRVLDTLYEYCSMHSSPEIAAAVLGARLPSIPAADKARCVVYTQLIQSDRHSLLSGEPARGLNLGCYKLLSRLCESDYIKCLKRAAKSATGDSETRSAFIAALKHHPERLAHMRQSLQTRMSCESLLNLEQLAEDGGAITSSVGLALYLHHMRREHQIPLNTSLGSLLDLCSGDPVRRSALLPVFYETILAALRQGIFSIDDSVALKECVVLSAARNFQQANVGLVEECWSANSAPDAILKLVRETEYNEISEEFILCHIDLINTKRECPLVALNTLFDAYFRQTHGFHTMAERWNSEAAYFNKVSYLWLRNMFVELSNGAAPDLDKDPLAEKYMKMLDCDVFIDVMKYQADQEGRDLARFMLNNLGDGRKSIYRSYLCDNNDAKLKMLRLVPVWREVVIALGFPDQEVQNLARLVPKQKGQRKGRR
ncbi:hypothetical protein PAPHI01_1429 [Pancytospora philotis]|nr:hypothetical protein PAPHI01_1429 [Pancytospora philotis]